MSVGIIRTKSPNAAAASCSLLTAGQTKSTPASLPQEVVSLLTDVAHKGLNAVAESQRLGLAIQVNLVSNVLVFVLRDFSNLLNVRNLELPPTACYDFPLQNERKY